MKLKFWLINTLDSDAFNDIRARRKQDALNEYWDLTAEDRESYGENIHRMVFEYSDGFELMAGCCENNGDSLCVESVSEPILPPTKAPEDEKPDPLKDFL